MDGGLSSRGLAVGHCADFVIDTGKKHQSRSA